MSNYDLVSLVISLVSSIVSIVVGLLAIWLTISFNRDSTATQMKIQSLIDELRGLTNASLSNQKDISDKMLNSILANGAYGKTDAKFDALSTEVSSVLSDIKEQMARSFSDAIGQVADRRKEASNAIAEVQEELDEVIDRASGSLSKAVSLPMAVADQLNRWRSLPANIVLLVAILQTGATSIEELEEYVDKYHLGSRWDISGIRNLLTSGILTGSAEQFEVAKHLRTPLMTWMQINEPILDGLVEAMSDPSHRRMVASLASRLTI